MNALIRGFGIGWKSVQLNWLPAVILQLMMIGLGMGYMAHNRVIIIFFEFLAREKSEGGYFFSFNYLLSLF
ncbi:MAG: hypothetical protein V4507_00890 [Verrucomicrobiota bacterium]